MPTLRQDLRFALRTLGRTPGFTAVALFTLAICFGANLTIFAVMDAILLRPLPFKEPNRLVALYNSYPKASVENDGASIPNYYERRGALPAFSGLAIFRHEAALVGEVGATQHEEVTRVSPDFFSTLGTAPALGRAFLEAETLGSADDVAILSHTYWRRHFNADPTILGRTVRVGGVPKTVVGVLPSGFRFLSSEAGLFLPFSSEASARQSSQRHSGGGAIRMIARLGSGVSLAEAQSQIDAHNAQLEKDNPQAQMIADAGFRTRVVPLHADHVKAIRPTLILMQVGVLFLLLIGSVNLMNLLLIRASHRVKEFAVRKVMGASWGQVVRLALVENTLLTVVGGCLGLGVGALGIGFLSLFGVERLPLGMHIGLDGRLIVVAVSGSLVTGLLLSIPIAWFNLRGDLTQSLQSESRSGTAGPAVQRLRHGFIVAQIALAFTLLAGAGLLGLSLKRTLAVAPGFQPDHLLTGRISLPPNTYRSGTAILAFHERLLEAVGQQPGVVAAGMINNIPFSGTSGLSAITVQGHALNPGESRRGHYAYDVSGDYFKALGIPLRRGRFLEPSDSHLPGRVCVVDEAFARDYWPRGDGLGQRLFRDSREGGPESAFTVVGVVGAVKQKGLTDEPSQGAVYFPYGYNADSQAFIAIRTNRSPEAFGAALLKAIRGIDLELTAADVRSMDARIADSLVARRSPALLMGIFAGVALMLAAIGTYGVLSYAALQRRREIGIRMALGALPQQVFSQFLSLGGKLLLGGLTLGALGAWAASRAMEAALLGVESIHWGTFTGTAGLLMIVVLVASLLPAIRAARVDPAEALRSE
ncbi:MAG: ABC transporter permease [Acidobacteria bacterium]|nr:ABC transporter permease [Acidobacteriota bacterium]